MTTNKLTPALQEIDRAIIQRQNEEDFAARFERMVAYLVALEEAQDDQILATIQRVVERKNKKHDQH